MDAPLVKHVTRVEAVGGLFRFHLNDECAKPYVDLVCDRDPRSLSEFELRSVRASGSAEGEQPTQLRYFRTELRARLLLGGAQTSSGLELIDEESGDHERAELNDDGDIAVLVTVKPDGLVQRREFELDADSGRYALVTFAEERDGVCETSLLFEEGKLNKKLALNKGRAREALAKSHDYASKLFSRTVTFRFD